MSGTPPASSTAWPVAIACGTVFALLYVLLRQDITHEYDIYWMLPRLRDGEITYPRHPVAFPLASLWLQVLEPFGTLHDRFRIANGISVGIAVLFFVRTAFAYGLRMRTALASAACFAMLPATMRAATVAELHGLFLPFAAAALWLGTTLVLRGPDLVRGAMVGLLTGVASGVHSTGHLLVGVVLVWFGLTWIVRRGLLRLTGTAATLVIVHVVVNYALRFLFTADAPNDPATEQYNTLTEHHLQSNGLLAMLHGEYLWPLLPISVLWPVAAAWNRSREGVALSITLAGSFVVYLAVCCILLTRQQQGYILFEYGSYQLPLAILATLACARAWGARAMLVAAIVAVGLSSYDLIWPHRKSPDPEFGKTAQSYLEQHDVRLIVGDHAEFDGIYERLYGDAALDPIRDRVLLIDQLVYEVHERNDLRADALALWFHPQVGGRPTVMTERALQRMRAMHGVFGECANEWLEKYYKLEPVLDGPLQARELAQR